MTRSGICPRPFRSSVMSTGGLANQKSTVNSAGRRTGKLFSRGLAAEIQGRARDPGPSFRLSGSRADLRIQNVENLFAANGDIAHLSTFDRGCAIPQKHGLAHIGSGSKTAADRKSTRLNSSHGIGDEVRSEEHT